MISKGNLKQTDKILALKELIKEKKVMLMKCCLKKKKHYFREEFSKCKGDIKGTWNVINKIIPINKKCSG